MDLQLKDKVIIVTGGAKGIGAAIVRGCCDEGAIPVIFDRDADAAGALQSDLRKGGRACGLILADVSTPEICAQAVGQTINDHGRIDALVNNAGINDKVGLEHGTPQEYVASLNRNLHHYYNMAHYTLPHLKGTRGTIVNVSSKTALTGQGGTSGYASSKGAILALTREWAVDLLDYGIRVNAVVPSGSDDSTLSAMAGHVRRSRNEATNHSLEDSAGETDDYSGRNCFHCAVFDLCEIWSHVGTIAFRRRWLCTPGSRIDLTGRAQHA